MKYAFYPGCSSQATGKEYEESTKAICKVLDIELVEVPDWNCCGSIDAVYSFNPLYSIALAARNLAIAKKMHMDVVTQCSACYFTLNRTNKILRENAETRSKVNEALTNIGFTYNGSVRVWHLADILLSDPVIQKIKEKAKIQLTNLNVASYYGCYLVRPAEICNFDDPEQPTRLDNLVEILGALKVDYYGKTRCCGSALGITDEESALKMSKDILVSAKNSGANCLITACTMCHTNLDAKQRKIESSFDTKINLPVLYFTQLIGLALGIEPKQLGLQRNLVSPRKIYPLTNTRDSYTPVLIVNAQERKFVSSDPEKCVGCVVCEYACSMTNEKTFNPTKSRIRALRLGPINNLAMACRHCEDPTCMAACPRNALSQEEDTGIIKVDEKVCKGCAWCISACKFGAMMIHPDKKVVFTCNSCQDETDGPQCVKWCPEEALTFTTAQQLAQKYRISAREKCD
jgi:heterodisulfide reductase subunit B